MPKAAKEKLPTSRPASPLYLLASLWPYLVITPLAYAAAGSFGVALFVASALFLAYRLVVVRLVLMSAHEKSLKALRQGRFEDAVLHCWDQERFFDRHPSLDRHRAFLLLSGARYPLRNVARHNRAYALFRAGRLDEARRLVDQLHEEGAALPPTAELRQKLGPAP